jgi:hypothetical protein
VKSYWAMLIALTVVVAAFGAVESRAAANNPNLAGKFECGPNAKFCQWSGKSFSVTQTGNHLDIKNDKGDEGTATLTSAISISAGPPWNMLGVISADGRTISWSNGSEWKKS